jgi:tyrosine-protein phosphatase SIW14
MYKWISFLLALLLTFLLVGSPLAYKRWHDKDYRNFHVVEEGVLYRSGQLPLRRLQQLVAANHIRTVVCLREGNDPLDQQEEVWVKAKGLHFVRIPPRQWFPDETGKIPADASVQTFRQVMSDPGNHPVLVHCFAGIHRTGIMCAIFRMEFQGWSKADAMTEMRTVGYSILDDHEDVQGYLQHYRPLPRSHP